MSCTHSLVNHVTGDEKDASQGDQDIPSKSVNQELLDFGCESDAVHPSFEKTFNLTQDSQEHSKEKMDTPGDVSDSVAIPIGKILVHDAQGPYLMDAGKWSTLNMEVTDEEPAQLTQEEDLMDNNQVIMSSEEECSQG